MIIVAGTARIPPDKLDRWRAAAETVIAATRAEAGCQVYCFAEDVLEPGLIRVFEIWESREPCGGTCWPTSAPTTASSSPTRPPKAGASERGGT